MKGEKLHLLKIGGRIIDDPAARASALEYFLSIPGRKLLIHGGGRRASELSQRLGIVPQMVDGRRITDAAALEVVVMVYAGLFNKELVAQLQAKGCHAIGLTGADGDTIRARKRPIGAIDYGFAGDIERVDAQALGALLEAGFTPVCCPITHDGTGQLLNTNADTIAASLAVALATRYTVHLDYAFERPGVLLDASDDTSLLGQLDPTTFRQLRAEGAIHTGMLPKLDNAFLAARAEVTVRIGNIQTLEDEQATRIASV